MVKTKVLISIVLFGAVAAFYYDTNARKENTIVNVSDFGARVPIPDQKNIILIGWDGVQRDHLYELERGGKLPNFSKYFLEQGSCVDTSISTGETRTKPGWAEILTGYNAEMLGIHSNQEYKPIPFGYTIFERMEEYFGDENIVTIFIGAKKNNIGARGPHEVCADCTISGNRIGWDKKPYRINGVIDEMEFLDEHKKSFFKKKEGDPYFFTAQNIDVYINNLGEAKNVLDRAFYYLDKYRGHRFFLFIHFEEPDNYGHGYGENSKEYAEAIERNDSAIVELMEKLKEKDIASNTIVYLTTDHGMDEGKNKHDNSPLTFFCSIENNLVKNGDRKDVGTTILHRFGIDISKINPSLEGKSLLHNER